MNLSSDGLRFFHPVDIYPENVQSRIGLIDVLHRLQVLEGFGNPDHRRFGSYSLLHADVAIFWHAVRLLYCYTGMAPLRQDLFLGLGFWHPYLYAHVAIWNEFRHTFLAPAFFLLFPNQTLLRRPRLSHSSTFFTWLRLAYPEIRPLLSAALSDTQKQMMMFEIDHVRAIRDGKVLGTKINPFRARYIHLLNLHTLFEFCLPVIQDYGSLLKSNDFVSFLQSYHKLLLLFILCRHKGTDDYYVRFRFAPSVLGRKWATHYGPTQSQPYYVL